MSYTIRNTVHEPQYDWGEVRIQGGESGVVIYEDGTYRTAFVEAFPKNPKTFIRGEGETVAEAETAAWEKYQRILNCKEHEFERKGYTNGCAVCVHCELFQSGVFEPTETCTICGQATFWTVDRDGKYYCEEHEAQIPEALQYSWHKKRK